MPGPSATLLIFVTPTIIKQGYGTGLEDQVSWPPNHSRRRICRPERLAQ